MANNKIFPALDRAASQAYQHHNRIYGFQTDPHLARYEQLTPSDFAHLSRTYGPDQTLRYITTMESRKLKGGR